MRALLLVLLFFQSANVLATDEIVCSSESFVVSIAVGTSGYVTSMVISDRSGDIFPGILSISNLSEDKRYANISKQLVDIEVLIEGKKLQISLDNNEGFIQVDSYKEDMSCDWLI